MVDPGHRGAVALAFLSPGSRWLGRHRDHLLITFTVTTYLAAPVLGFGWMLLVLGLAQLRSTAGHLRFSTSPPSWSSASGQPRPGARGALGVTPIPPPSNSQVWPLGGPRIAVPWSPVPIWP